MILRPPEFNPISQPTPESRFSIEATLNWCIPSLTFKLPNVTRPPKPKPGIRRICIHFIALRLRVEENLRDQIMFFVIAAKHIDRVADTSRAKRSQITRECSSLMLHTWLVAVADWSEGMSSTESKLESSRCVCCKARRFATARVWKPWARRIEASVGRSSARTRPIVRTPCRGG